MFSGKGVSKGSFVVANRKRVLAVDDNEDILELIQISLEADYDVITLSDPVDLYEVMDLFEPDLLILDVMMPHINGFQLLEMLRKNPGTKELPVIILSAKTSAGEIKHGYRLGATMYLTKPFQPDRLKKNVETQFNCHPPENDKKSLSGAQLAFQIELTPAYRRGHLHASQSLARKEHVIDARKRLEEKIRKTQEDMRKRVSEKMDGKN